MLKTRIGVLCALSVMAVVPEESAFSTLK